MKPSQPSNLEMQILSLLWEHGPLTARSVQERLPDGKPRAYTTVLSLLQVMEKKGLVTHEADGNKHVFGAKAQRRAVLGSMLGGLVKTLFGGRPSAAMQQLLENTEVSEAELAEMRTLLDAHHQRVGAKRGSTKTKKEGHE